jgi:hypothetical protein
MKFFPFLVGTLIVLCLGFQETVLAQPTASEGIVIRDEIIFIQSFVGVAARPTSNEVEAFIVKTNDILCNARNGSHSEHNSTEQWKAPFSKTDTVRELYLIRIQGKGPQKDKICEIKMLKKGNSVFVLKRACGTEDNYLTDIQRSNNNMFATLTTNKGFKCRLLISNTGFSAMPDSNVGEFKTTIFKAPKWQRN